MEYRKPEIVPLQPAMQAIQGCNSKPSGPEDNASGCGTKPSTAAYEVDE